MDADTSDSPKTRARRAGWSGAVAPRFVAVTGGIFVLALALGGCSSGPRGGDAKAAQPTDSAASDTVARADDTQTRADLPPLNVAPPLPPAPTPATFDVADLAEKVESTVVNITTTQKVNLPAGHPFELFMGPEGMGPTERTGAGTGFIIDTAGYVVTNEHVVRDADEVTVKLWDDREIEADVVGRDPKLDVALLKLKNAKDLPSARLGSSDTLRIGEHVLAVGNPYGLGHTVTLGIVSAKSRFIGAGSYDDFIQTDAAINPGNSGGPLFNWRGEVVGMATAIRPGANNIGFAIPVDALKDVLGQLRDHGHVTRGKLGLVFQPMSNELAAALKLDAPKGALVSQLEAGGAAARAGLKPGDVVLAVNDTPIAHAEELPRRVARNAPGTQIKLTYLRDGKKLEAKATLDTLEDDDTMASPPAHGAPSAEPSNNKLGVAVSNARGGGVRIDGLTPTSVLKEVRPGDVIVELDGKPVTDLDTLGKQLAAAKPGAVLLGKVRRGEVVRFVPIPMPK
ncbi:MAG TPA: trypsin-like peptidase domain-containing protein [Polyangiaceae bacterium]|nr:trypsin-like peptidase domain-containing protein [Polyangiaceae bacterium]